MSLPLFHASRLQPRELDDALREVGGFLLEMPSDCEPVLDAARALFSLPREEKAKLAIANTRNFRGWSEMQNERDWREQLHLGPERPIKDLSHDYHRLEGPNPWPADASWRRTVSSYQELAATVGQSILEMLAEALGVDKTLFSSVRDDGYVLLKLIGYHPQTPGAQVRSGVAAHVDFSWLTMTLQDRAGLEILGLDGTWTMVEPRPSTVWVHPGELLQEATQRRYLATAHRVVNASESRTRVSIPVFINPPLDAMVPIFETLERQQRQHPGDAHVHHVVSLEQAPRPFHFGEAEWRRKGLNGWCVQCSPPAEKNIKDL